jgi:LysR family glycine cleavage system transcriptional activator
MDDRSLKAWTPSSISALRAFEAAARHMNFTAAAAELNVTQSAVSHAIRDVESRLSVSLFRRNGRVLELTEAGRRYAPYVREALARLKEGDLAVTDPERRARVLTVSVSPSFAAKWLAPRIGEFAARHPDLDLRISASAQHVDFSDDDIDLAIRHGDGAWPALAAIRLCTERWLPACSPTLRRERVAPAQIAELPLIHHRDSSAWRLWFERAGIDPPAAIDRGLTFNEMSLAIDAAVSGRGVALARSALAARDLIAGRLVCLADRLRPAEIGYWIVWPKERPRSRKIARFVDWLKDEANAEERALADVLPRSS